MSLGHSRVLIPAVMSASLLAGLSVPESSGATTPDTTLPVTGDGPVGVIAIGHSGLTAENSDPQGPFQPALENSWASGTNPDVNSVYLRLIEVHPETEGHVANTAAGGAMAVTLTFQAEQALSVVPTPELVIIQTIDNDIVCPPGDADHFADFGDSITSALDVFVAASPESRILMVGQLGRPVPAFLEELVAAHPEVKPELTGTGEQCNGFFDPSGAVVQENFDYLTEIIEAYETEQQRRCDAVPQCRTDGGVRAAYVDTFDNLSSDLNHLNVLGQAAQAELIWPVVVDVLQLDDTTGQSVPSTDPAD